MTRLAGRRAVITGAGRGIGYAIAQRFAGEGAAVALVDVQVERLREAAPLGRLASPEDVAAMALFLASADSDYCTRQAMNVTGGMIMH